MALAGLCVAVLNAAALAETKTESWQEIQFLELRKQHLDSKVKVQSAGH